MKKHIVYTIIGLLSICLCSCQKDPIPEPATLATSSVSNVTSCSAVVVGSISGDNASISKYGVCWSTSQNPTMDDSVFVVEESVNGDFECAISSLEENTTYYAKIFVVNAGGTFYGNEITFTTNALCSVITGEANNILATKASFAGRITSDGNSAIIKRGVCWSTHEMPTIEDSIVFDNVNSEGEYKALLNNLQPQTKYYYRAFAENAAGVAYGAQKSFSTVKGPETKGLSVVEIGLDYVVCKDTIVDGFGGEMNKCGFCYSLNPDVVLGVSNYVVMTMDVNGAINGSIDGLQAGTTYYVRSFMESSLGLTYGEEITVSTLDKPTLAIYNVYSIQSTSAMEAAVITNDGGSPIIEKGFCYSEIGADETSISIATTDNIFYGKLIDLQPSTTYSVRAYAKNSVGTSYSDAVTFTTKE